MKVEKRMTLPGKKIFMEDNGWEVNYAIIALNMLSKLINKIMKGSHEAGRLN